MTALSEEIREANRFSAQHAAARREEAEALLEEIERSRMAVREVVRAELARLAKLRPALIDRTDWKGRTGIALEQSEAIEGQTECVDQTFADAFDADTLQRINEEAGQ